MPTPLENLQTAYANACAELAALDQTRAGGLPNASASGVDHNGYRQGILDRIDRLRAAISAETAMSGGPFEITTFVEN